jgi:hypothetical protein
MPKARRFIGGDAASVCIDDAGSAERLRLTEYHNVVMVVA